MGKTGKRFVIFHVPESAQCALLLYNIIPHPRFTFHSSVVWERASFCRFSFFFFGFSLGTRSMPSLSRILHTHTQHRQWNQCVPVQYIMQGKHDPREAFIFAKPERESTYLQQYPSIGQWFSYFIGDEISIMLYPTRDKFWYELAIASNFHDTNGRQSHKE